MSFQISALPAEAFAELWQLTDAELSERHIVRRVADVSPGFPCRVSLADAAPGEELLLLNYQHLPDASPYRAAHAIFVRKGAETAAPAIGEVPDVLARRLLSVRAYDASAMMIDAEVTQGDRLDTVIERLFADPRAAFLHVHNAKPGCYAARVDRA